MDILNNWSFYVILYLVFEVLYNQCYKVITDTMISAGSLTVVMEALAGILSLILIPFFKFKMPTNPKVYLFLGLAIIFYALSDRLSTTARSGVEASTYSMLKQLATVFMIIAGLLFFKEPFVIKKIIGATLIIISNIFVFYQKGKMKLDRYVWFGVFANLFMAIALFIDVNYSEKFNLPIYVSITLIMPALLILLVEKIKRKELIEEYKNCKKVPLIITAISLSLMMIFKLRAYQLGKVTIVAPLCSLTVILNIIVAYFVLKEKDNLTRKIIAGILIVIGIILIKS